MRLLSVIILAAIVLCPAVYSQVYTTYHWHMQQPIYWPEVSSWDSDTYQKAYESIVLAGTHPENNLSDIFGKDDRVAAYQYRVRDAIGLISQVDGGAQISYSGCLVENVSSLANAGSLGYYSGWEGANQQARGWLTSGGNRKLDIVIFTYHHALGPLVDEEALRKEIQIYKELYPNIWGSGTSVGFFPAELSFSERMIKVLVEEGVEWVFVPNNHLSRACDGFPLTLGTGGEMCDPPNQADVQNPSQSNWFSKTIQRGCTPTNAYPFAYQPHKAKYVDPETGTEYKITVVPVAQAMSWSDGYQQYGTDDIDQIAWASSVSEPMLIVLAHDGDNAYAGGYSYYLESVPNFCNAAASAGYIPTVVQEYLQDNPVSESDVVHVEDGSWINADGDFGSPDFINWNWPLFDSSGDFDIENGWAEDERNWAVITAAQNRVETAEQIAGGVDISQVQDPDNSATNAELAWHFYLPALTSGYMYYGTVLDMEVKPTIACNNAIERANLVIGDGSTDQTAPSIWIPQQLPHNPGATGFGSLWGYQAVEHSRDFWVWTFVADVSGVSSVTFKYRIDNDGVNPLLSNQNETYAGGDEVGDWVGLAMTARDFPAENVYNNNEIDFFEMPAEIADQYYIHVQEPAIVDEGGVLVDYYVEAVDSKGYVKRSPILHTYVGIGNGSSSGNGDVATWEPASPQAGQTLSISYDLDSGSLDNSTDPVYIHIGHSGWQDIINSDPEMEYNTETSKWVYEYSTPSDATTVDFVFNDGVGNWDNNYGLDWHVSVSGGSAEENFEIDGALDENAQLIGTSNDINLYAAWNNNYLYVACDDAEDEDLFIFISNGNEILVSAPWSKSGTVAQWIAYLANESTNSWSGWFDGGSEQAVGDVLEGTVNWNNEFGTIPEIVYVALGVYETDDAGVLTGQVPLGDGDGNIQISEYFEVNLAGDLNYDGSIDMTDLGIFAGYWLYSDCGDENDWCGMCDIDRANGVNISDFEKMASFWLK